MKLPTLLLMTLYVLKTIVPQLSLGYNNPKISFSILYFQIFCPCVFGGSHKEHVAELFLSFIQSNSISFENLVPLQLK